MENIYFDNAATTQIRKEVYEAMQPYFIEHYGNPSSIYEIARTNKKAIDNARDQIAKAINADAGEIFFTGSGTEADNWAIKGVAEAYVEKGNHIITSAIEHHAVLHTCQFLETKGFEVTYLPVKENGIIDLEELKAAIRPTTVLISIMFANNEIGSLQPIAEIGAIAKENGVLFHTDAVQALGHVPVDVKAMHIDLLTITAHKIYGPKGTGVLYIKKGVRLKPFIHGGGQERGRRAGTENVPAIVGFGKAAELVTAEMREESIRLLRLRNKLVDGVLGQIPHAWLNGDRGRRLPGNANISFKYIEGESILLLLETQGIFASSGSACTSGSLDPSHVLLAIGLPHEDAHGSLRLTLGRYNTEAEVDRFLTALPPIITRLRQMSPLYEASKM